MNKTQFSKIGLSNIKIRPQYYLKCAYCGRTIEDDDPHNLVAIANFHGWVYDYEHDSVLCDDCKEEVTS